MLVCRELEPVLGEVRLQLLCVGFEFRICGEVDGLIGGLTESG